MLTIETTRYSKVVAAFMERYPEAVPTLDKHRPAGRLSSWCTNAALLKAIDFSLRQGRVEPLAFHDSPRTMWASAEALPLVEELAALHILRYTVAPPKRPSILACMFGRRSAV
jgi:hypothetical protein